MPQVHIGVDKSWFMAEIIFIASTLSNTAACVCSVNSLFPPLSGSGWLLMESTQVSHPLSSCCFSSWGGAAPGLLVPSCLGQADMLEMPSSECNLCHRQGKYELVGDVEREGGKERERERVEGKRGRREHLKCTM